MEQKEEERRSTPPGRVVARQSLSCLDRQARDHVRDNRRTVRLKVALLYAVEARALGHVLSDTVDDVSGYFTAFFRLFLLHFSITAFVRMIILTMASRRLKSGKITYTTIIIGGNQKAFELYEDIRTRKKSLGNSLIGFIESEKNGQQA